MMNVFLDNRREPPEGFVHVTTVDECKKRLLHETVDNLCLDHGLGRGNPTGYDLAAWMVNSGIHVGKVYLHSGNYLARRAMRRALTLYAETNELDMEVNDFPYPSA